MQRPITEYHAKFYAHELTKPCPSHSVEKLAGTLVDAQDAIDQNKDSLLDDVEQRLKQSTHSGGLFPSDSLLPKLFLMRLIRNARDHYHATALAGCFDAPIWDNAVFLAVMALFRTFMDNTRAVPLVRKENAHKGRVFFCPNFKGHWKGTAA